MWSICCCVTQPVSMMKWRIVDMYSTLNWLRQMSQCSSIFYSLFLLRQMSTICIMITKRTINYNVATTEVIVTENVIRNTMQIKHRQQVRHKFKTHRVNFHHQSWIFLFRVAEVYICHCNICPLICIGNWRYKKNANENWRCSIMSVDDTPFNCNHFWGRRLQQQYDAIKASRAPAWKMSDANDRYTFIHQICYDSNKLGTRRMAHVRMSTTEGIC